MQATFGLFESSVIQITLEISPVAIIVLSGVDLMTNESARLMLCGYRVAQSLRSAFTSTYFSGFLFYNRSRVAPWIYLWVFVFKSAICAWLCFPKFGIDGWVKLPDTKGSSSSTSFSGSLILPPPGASEEKPWLGLVTCLPESGRWQLNYWRDGRPSGNFVYT